MAKAARECGADLIGLVFADSRRRVDPATAQSIALEVPGIGKVGVFVNAPLSQVQAIAKQCRLDFVQLHGNEDADYCGAVGLPVIKAVRADLLKQPEQLYRLNHHPAAWILADSVSHGQFGGAGVPFDWLEVQKVRAQLTKPLMIAGGLNSDNVRSAMTLLAPDGVDVSSGVEVEGRKNRAKMAQFISRVAGKEGSYAERDHTPESRRGGAG